MTSLGDITLGYVGTASINGAISAGGNFQNSGTGILSSSSVTAGGSISFSGNPTLHGTVKAGTFISCASSLQLDGTTTLTAPAGISIGSQINTNGGAKYDLTLDASTSPISIGGDVVNVRSFYCAKCKFKFLIFD